MNTEMMPESIDPEIDVRLTALVLGEASDFEAAQLQQLMSQRPELAAWYAQLQRLHGVLNEWAMLELHSQGIPVEEKVEEAGPWMLSPEKRASLLDVLGKGDVETPEKVMPLSVWQKITSYRPKRRGLWIATSVAASLVMVCSALMLSSRQTASMNNWRVAAKTGGRYDLAPAVEATPAPSAGLPNAYYLQDDVQYFGNTDGIQKSLPSADRGYSAPSTAAGRYRATPNSSSLGIAPSTVQPPGGPPTSSFARDLEPSDNVTTSPPNAGGGAGLYAMPSPSEFMQSVTPRIVITDEVEELAQVTEPRGGELKLNESDAIHNFNVPPQEPSVIGATPLAGSAPVIGGGEGVAQTPAAPGDPVASAPLETAPEAKAEGMVDLFATNVPANDKASLGDIANNLERQKSAEEGRKGRWQVQDSPDPFGSEVARPTGSVAAIPPSSVQPSAVPGSGPARTSGTPAPAKSEDTLGYLEQRDQSNALALKSRTTQETDSDYAMRGLDAYVDADGAISLGGGRAGKDSGGQQGQATTWEKGSKSERFGDIGRMDEKPSSDEAPQSPRLLLENESRWDDSKSDVKAGKELQGLAKQKSDMDGEGDDYGLELNKELREEVAKKQEELADGQASRKATAGQSNLRSQSQESIKENAAGRKIIDESELKDAERRLTFRGRESDSRKLGKSGDQPNGRSKSNSGTTIDGLQSKAEGKDAKTEDATHVDFAMKMELLGMFDQSENALGDLTSVGKDLKPKLQQEKAQPPTGLNETRTETERFSTFSLHVSDVSFKLAMDSLAKGQWPEAAKIRLEEFLNAFDYQDPLPSETEKVACQIEQASHPFLMQRNVLRVSMRTSAVGRNASTPLRLTVLVDNSGSMQRADRAQTLRRAFETLASQLTAVDQVTLISFANEPRLRADRIPGNEIMNFVNILENSPVEGGTNMESALELGLLKSIESKTPGAESRVILMTDGAVNLGDADPSNLSNIVLKMRDQGVAFDAAGISAQDLNDDVLEALTRQGDGRYYLLDNAEQVDAGFAQQIAGALRPSAKNVKVQVEFNPQRVRSYKLLGFEKHLLKKEDFRNDKVDAAELAAAEAGNALYHYEIIPEGIGDIGSVSVRFQDLSTGLMVEKRWPIAYEPNAQRLEQANSSLKVATAAVLLAAHLKGEPVGENVDLQYLAGVLNNLDRSFSQSDRVEQLRRMIEQARQIAGASGGKR